VTTPVLLSKIAVVVTVPVVVVFNPSALTDPVTCKKLAAFITGNVPTRADVWGLSPVALVPLPMVSDGIPITVHPDEFRCGSRRHDVNHSGWWRGTNPDADRDLRTENG
jgi:hypothetical protein